MPTGPPNQFLTQTHKRFKRRLTYLVANSSEARPFNTCKNPPPDYSTSNPADSYTKNDRI